MEGRSPAPFDPIAVTDDLAAADRRGYARYRVGGEWRVHDRARSRLIGLVADIGLGGLRLQAPEPIPPARRYALSIDVQCNGVDRAHIEVIARCAWHCARPDRQFETGFEFVELTPQTRHRIAELIDELAL